jgi:hypothetical protein
MTTNFFISFHPPLTLLLQFTRQKSKNIKCCLLLFDSRLKEPTLICCSVKPAGTVKADISPPFPYELFLTKTNDTVIKIGKLLSQENHLDIVLFYQISSRMSRKKWDK